MHIQQMGVQVKESSPIGALRRILQVPGGESPRKAKECF